MYSIIGSFSVLIQVSRSVGLNGYIIAVTVVGGYSFLLASFVIFAVAERQSKVSTYTWQLLYVHVCIIISILLCRQNTLSLLVV